MNNDKNSGQNYQIARTQFHGATGNSSMYKCTCFSISSFGAAIDNIITTTTKYKNNNQPALAQYYSNDNTLGLE